MSPKHIWTSREVCRALESLGFELLPKRGKGSHSLYSRLLRCRGNEPVNVTVSVPYHLGQGTVRAIADRVGLTVVFGYSLRWPRASREDYGHCGDDDRQHLTAHGG